MNLASNSLSGEDTNLGGNYTANVLGTIRSHLEGLQGYDVMALELIQNADDASAEEISFDVNADALIVSNSATFSYCGDLNKPRCSNLPTGLDKLPRQCDFHNIIEVASGGKLGDPDNIGRFGIGFLSTYQITDSPEIRSLDMHLRLHPELAKWSGQLTDSLNGTRFVFPWARNGSTTVRTLLQLSAISDQHVGQVVEGIKTAIEQCLLFLKHVSAIHLNRNGTHLLSAKIDRTSTPKIAVSFDGGGAPQRWLILTTDAKNVLQPIIAAHPRLQNLKRKTLVTVWGAPHD